MNEKFTKLKIQDRETVPSKIVDAIVDLIINKELQPGDKLPSENEWMEIFGVGRNSIREAIKMLSSLGIVEIRKGQGTFVAKKVSSNMFNPLLFAMVLDQPLSIHLVELRIMIEKGVGELVYWWVSFGRSIIIDGGHLAFGDQVEPEDSYNYHYEEYPTDNVQHFVEHHQTDDDGSDGSDTNPYSIAWSHGESGL